MVRQTRFEISRQVSKPLADSADVDLNQQHRYLRLPHPRTSSPQLYLSYISSSHDREEVVEMVKVNCAHRRAWFIGDSKIDGQFSFVRIAEINAERCRRINTYARPHRSSFPRHPHYPLVDLVE